MNTTTFDLMDYATANRIGDASLAQLRASIDAAKHDGGAGVIVIDGRECYVVGDDPEPKTFICAYCEQTADNADCLCDACDAKNEVKEDRCPNCAPLGCDCSDSQRPSLDPKYDASILPSGRRCHCGGWAAGGDCMCYETDDN